MSSAAMNDIIISQAVRESGMSATTPPSAIIGILAFVGTLFILGLVLYDMSSREP